MDLLGGVILLLSVGLLAQRRVAGVIALAALLGVVVAIAAAGQGWRQGDWQLYLLAAITLADGIAIPSLLGRIARRLQMLGAVEAVIGLTPGLLLGLGLVALSLTIAPEGASRMEALSVLLVGLLLMVARRPALVQVVGLLSAQNGVLLAAVQMPGLPLLPVLSIALTTIPALLTPGLFAFRVRHRLEALDLRHLDLEGSAQP
ncbi:MAG: hydrogenase-4 component E [Geminicoccaceae bacterium]